MCIVIGNIFVISYLLAEKNIYYWDVSGYWIQCIDFTRALSANSGEAMKSLYDSIATSDYNLLPVLPLSIAANTISSPLQPVSHTLFIMAAYNLYAVPFICLVIRLMRRMMLDNETFSAAKLTLAAAVCMLFTAALTPLLGGYIDIVGMMYAMLICIIMYKHRFNLRAAWIISLLLVMLSLLRRWYLFWAVAFFPAAAVAYVVKCVCERGYTPKMLIGDMFKLFCIGLGYIAVMLLFFRAFFLRALTNNFADIYDAYKGDGFAAELTDVICGIGLVFIILAAFGFVVMLLKKKMRVMAIFLAAQSVIIFVLFTRIQAFGVQHLYLFAPAVLIFAAAGAVFGVGGIKRKSARLCAHAAVMGLLLFNFIYVYTPMGSFAMPVFSDIRRPPRVMAGYSTIREITSYLNTATDGKNELVYVLASSDVINDEILVNAFLPHVRYAVNGLVSTYHIDKRDGFPNHLFMADILVVGDPVQTHMRPEDQQIVTVPTKKILAGDAANLELMKTFTIDAADGKDAVSVHIYRRVGAYDIGFAKEIEDELKAGYPRNPAVYELNYFYAMMDKPQNRIAEQGEIYYNLDGEVLVTAKSEHSVGFALSNQRHFAELSFNIRTGGDRADIPMLLTVLDGEDVLYSGNTSDSAKITLDISQADKLEFQIEKANADEAGWAQMVIGEIELRR